MQKRDRTNEKSIHLGSDAHELKSSLAWRTIAGFDLDKVRVVVAQLHEQVGELIQGQVAIQCILPDEEVMNLGPPGICQVGSEVYPGRGTLFHRYSSNRQ